MSAGTIVLYGLCAIVVVGVIIAIVDETITNKNKRQHHNGDNFWKPWDS